MEHATLNYQLRLNVVSVIGAKFEQTESVITGTNSNIKINIYLHEMLRIPLSYVETGVIS